MKYLVQIAFYILIIAALVVINFNQLSSIRAEEESPISAPITSPEVTPVPTVEPTNPPSENHDNHDNGGSNSGGSNGGDSGPSVCGEQKPGTPVLLSVIKTGPNQVKLNWSKPVGPVSSYVLAYGLNPNKMLYGNPNIGNTTSYVVNKLQAGTTYYFQVRAANGCTPGAFSNTLGINASGKTLGVTTATGFKAGVTNLKPKQNLTQSNIAPAKNPEVAQKAPEVKAPTFIDNFVYKAIRFFYR